MRSSELARCEARDLWARIERRDSVRNYDMSDARALEECQLRMPLFHILVDDTAMQVGKSECWSGSQIQLDVAAHKGIAAGHKSLLTSPQSLD